MVICTAFLDFIQTTIGADWGGRISIGIAGGLGRIAKNGPQLYGNAGHHYGGSFVMATLAAVWVMAHWTAAP